MPTADDFDGAARALGDHAARISGLLGPVDAAMGPAVLRGGRLTAAVEAAVDNGHVAVRSAAVQLESLAEEARRRAAVCREALAAALSYDGARRRYTGDLADWSEAGAVGRPPSPPRRPDRPPWWVEF